MVPGVVPPAPEAPRGSSKRATNAPESRAIFDEEKSGGAGPLPYTPSAVQQPHAVTPSSVPQHYYAVTPGAGLPPYTPSVAPQPHTPGAMGGLRGNPKAMAAGAVAVSGLSFFGLHEYDKAHS